MARKATPQIDKTKDTILNELNEDEQAEVLDWLERVFEVRAADRAAEDRRKQRQAATAQAGDAK